MRVKSHRVPFGKHPRDERGRRVGDVTIDQEEGRRRALPRQHVEQVRRGRRVRAIVEGEINRWRIGLRHVPYRTSAGKRIEQAGCRRRMREGHDRDAEGEDNPHGREVRHLPESPVPA
jgi:hypothetical protein